MYDLLSRFYRNLKPGVPKRWLFFIAAMFWAYAAYRVLGLVRLYMTESTMSQWEVITFGLIGLVIFFNLVFKKVCRKHIHRITFMEQKNPCFFAFFGWKSYLLIAMMVCMGIFFSRIHLMPVVFQSVFYIALGGSLFFSAIVLLNAGILYREGK